MTHQLSQLHRLGFDCSLFLGVVLWYSVKDERTRQLIKGWVAQQVREPQSQQGHVSKATARVNIGTCSCVLRYLSTHAGTMKFVHLLLITYISQIRQKLYSCDHSILLSRDGSRFDISGAVQGGS